MRNNYYHFKLAGFVFLLLTSLGCDDENKPEQMPPSAEFGATAEEIYIWDEISFISVSENIPLTWEWHFEGGYPELSVDPEPKVLYKNPGKFSVKLTVANEYGEQTKEIENFIQVSEYRTYYGTLIDSRDNQTYKTTKVAGQFIMAQNLNYNTDEAVYYDNDPGNGTIYGMLYTWETAMEACPDGWRLPTRSEYDLMREYLGGEYEAGGNLKAPGTEYWNEPNAYGTNSTSFTAVGSGAYMPGHLDFFGMNESATFWTQTETDYGLAWSMALSSTNARMAIQNTTNKNLRLSVRCIKD